MLDLGIGGVALKALRRVRNKVPPNVATKPNTAPIVNKSGPNSKVPPPTPSEIFNASNKKNTFARIPNPVNAPTVSTHYAGQSPTNPVVSAFKKLTFIVDPQKPVSPRINTPLHLPKSRIEFNKRRTTPRQNIVNRPSPGGAPPPSPSEKTVHRTIPQWTAWLNSIPPESRSISGRDVAMTPRIDESAPTQVAAAVVPMQESAVAGINAQDGVSVGLQTDNTVAPSNVTDMAFLIAVAFFGFMFLKGR